MHRLIFFSYLKFLRLSLVLWLHEMRTYFLFNVLGQERVGACNIFPLYYPYCKTFAVVRCASSHILHRCSHARQNRGDGQKSSYVDQFMLKLFMNLHRKRHCRHIKNINGFSLFKNVHLNALSDQTIQSVSNTLL